MNQQERLKILLIDDDDGDVKAMERELKKQKNVCEVTRAYNGYEALEMIKAEKINFPFIIVLDLNMPCMGGLEFLSALRSETEMSVPIFILSTSDLEKDNINYRRDGVKGYFIKGDEQNGLTQLVKSITEITKISTVLVVDDELLDYHLIKRMLMKTDLYFNVQYAASLSEGFDYLDKTMYTNLFIDYLLPGETGLSAIEKIVAEKSTLDVVLMSSIEDESIAIATKKCGGTLFLNKDKITSDVLHSILGK